MSMSGVAADVVILTALGLEYDAVRTYLTDTHQHTDATGTRYEIGTLGAGRVALALIGEGNLAAAAITGRALALGPRAVIFVGVAGGLTDSVRLGDVVVATRVHAYHGGRDEAAGFRPRPKSWPLAHALEQAAREVARSNSWSRSLSSAPAVHFKPIVSGEVVIDTRESELAKFIAEHYSDAVAAEMESAGIAEAAHRGGFPNTITVRGISDNADGAKRRADAAGWQSIASANAAAFAAALAERIIHSPPLIASDPEPTAPASQTNVHAGGAITMKRSVIAGGNVTQSRTVRIGLGGAAAVVALVAAIIISNQTGENTGPARGTIRTQDDQIIAASDARKYPHGTRYAPVTGFLSPFFGSVGVERASDDALKSGNAVVVTIHSKVQLAAHDALTAKGHTGAVVVIRPRTGEILAMASTPSFDPNLLATTENAEAKQNYQRLIDDPKAPLLNRATAKTYAPGATFTLVSAAAALEAGNGKDLRLTAASKLNITGNVELTNANGTPCGPGPTASLETALELSCTTAFAQLAHDLGAGKLVQQAEKFGVGETGLTVPLPVVPSCLGSESRNSCMAFETGPGLYLSGIGQRDVRFTPLQNAMIAATIANGGMRMRPQLIKAQPEPVERAMTERNANTLRDMMVRAEDAAGGSAGPRIASKSATGQIGPAAQSGPDSWYVAFAPADDPKIAIAVLLESKQDAAVIGRAIISQALAAGI